MKSIHQIKAFTKELTVLYVEDDVKLAAGMQKYLQKIFANVIVAHNGLEGLTFYRQGRFDIVISDLAMPVMDGIEMIENIKKLDENQAVLITSVHDETEYLYNSLKLGVDGYIIKPFDSAQLNRELYRVARMVEKLKENEAYKQRLEQMVEEKTSKLNDFIAYQKENYDKTLTSIVDLVESRDTYTAGHSRRVAHYCRLIAEEMGYSEEECSKIYQAGILHDLGKIATPDAILLNPKRLNSLEYRLIQEHVSVSYKILKYIPMFEELSNIVYQHHERYDGKGYPRGLKGDMIHPLSRIMIVADAFDAMTTNRIYKSRKSVDEALEELQNASCQQFHPEVVEAALIALRDVTIDAEINQLPSSQLEEERFAYFFKYGLCHIYNQSYLELILVQNRQLHKYRYLDAIFIKYFSRFNKEYGWAQGDQILIEVARLLGENFRDSLLFRIFGDDFILLSQREQDLDQIEESLREILQSKNLEYTTKSIDLKEVAITNVSEIEKELKPGLEIPVYAFQK